MLPFTGALLLLPYLGAAVSSALSLRPEARDIHVRAAPANGSCVSAPDAACIALVSLCVGRIASGQVGSTSYWTDRICAASATCASMSNVLDAACCAGTCKTPTQIGNLDVNNVYSAMVGSGCTASNKQTCTLTWQPFVDWFYGTIQQTGTGVWPNSGDDVLVWWAGIANWTGFCKGTNCVDAAIPYSNFNDWFHFSSAIIATTPGTPQYAPVFPTLDDNLDNTTPTMLWPCVGLDDGDCSVDLGAVPTGTFDDPDAEVQVVAPPEATSVSMPNITTFAVPVASTEDPGSSIPAGFAPYEPPSIPPPVYVNGTLIPLVLNGIPVQWNMTNTPLTIAPSRTRRNVPAVKAPPAHRANTTSQWDLGGLDVPSPLPTLTYYCPYFPGICQNIRSHPDWDKTTDSMVLTYDPLDGGKKRRQVCTPAVRTAMQNAGACDPRQHSPKYWKTSCDEFPFSASLEGGLGNVVLLAVADGEQDLQGTLQASIAQLRMAQEDASTVWSKPKFCHRYTIKLVNTIPAGAPAAAIGSLNSGSAYFTEEGQATKFVMNSNVVNKPAPPAFAVDTPYDPTATALVIPKTNKKFNCAPCPPAKPSPIAPIPRELAKRQASSCSVPPGPPLATSSAGASAVAAASAASASAAAQAAAAAIASAAASASAAEAAAAAAALSAANLLGPSADALAAAANDAALAAAIAASQAAVSDAQSALSSIFSLGPSLPDWLSDVVSHVSSSSTSVSNAVDSSSNVVNPATPAPPVVDTTRDPVVNSGPPPGAPAAKCFPAGSKGFLQLDGSYLIDLNGDPGKSQITLVDAGSNAYFGLVLNGLNVALAPVQGCNNVYFWAAAGGPTPDFQVDCSSNELNSYWNGARQQCYSDFDSNPGVFVVICGNSLANIYSCQQKGGSFGSVALATFTWATS